MNIGSAIINRPGLNAYNLPLPITVTKGVEITAHEADVKGKVSPRRNLSLEPLGLGLLLRRTGSWADWHCRQLFVCTSERIIEREGEDATDTT